MKTAKSILALLMAFAMLMSFAVIGSAENSAAVALEKEQNDAYKTATAFGFATKIKGKLGTADDIDFYSFTADSDGSATITISHDEIDDASQDIAYFEVTVYDVAEKEMVMFRSTGAEKETISPSFAITAKATYFIKVTMGSIHSSTLEYTVTASFDKNARTEKEPNNQAALATPLDLSTQGDSKPYYGTISSTGTDVDFYRVVPKSKGVIYLYIYNGNIPADFKATLYTHYETVDGVLIEEAITSISINSNEEVAKSVAIGIYDKEYMLKVEGLNGKTGGYRTRVFFQPVSDAEMEYNNKPHLFNAFTIGENRRGTISQDNDVDFYAFKPTKGNVGYEITLGLADDKSPKTGSWYITVTEGKNASAVPGLERIEVKAGETKKFTTDALESDNRNYYIKIEKGSTLTTEIYRLGVTALTPPEDPDDPNEPSFFEQIKILFDKFWDNNFASWVDTGVNFIGMLSSLLPSIIQAFPKIFTWLIGFIG